MPRGIVYPPSAGGGPPGSVNVKEVEVNLGATPTYSGQFTVIDGEILAGSNIIMTLAPGPYTGKGTLADEAQMHPGILFAPKPDPAGGQMLVDWSAPYGAIAAGNVKVNYLIG